VAHSHVKVPLQKLLILDVSRIVQGGERLAEFAALQSFQKEEALREF